MAAWLHSDGSRRCCYCFSIWVKHARHGAEKTKSLCTARDRQSSNPPAGFGGQGWLGAPTSYWPARIRSLPELVTPPYMLVELGPQRGRKVDWVAHSVSFTHAPDLYF